MVIVEQSELVTFAPAPQQYSSKGSSILRTETEAQSQTKTSWQITVRSPSINAALLMKDCGIRCQVHWFMSNGIGGMQRGGNNRHIRGTFRKRPYGFAMGLQSLTVTVNNSSFSFSNTDVMQILAGLWGYGEGYQGEPSDEAPFKFMAAKDRIEASNFPDWWADAAGDVKYDGPGALTDPIMVGDFFMPLPVGIFLSAALPRIKSMSGYEAIAVPHLNEISINVTMKPDWCKYLLQSMPYARSAARGRRVDRSLGFFQGDQIESRLSTFHGWDPDAGGGGRYELTNHNGNAPDFSDARMLVGGVAIDGVISIKKPRLCCVWSSVPSGIPPTYSLGFHRFVSYREVVEVPNAGLKATAHFSNIQLDVTPNIFIVVCRSIQDWHSCNYFAPFDWKSIKITSTTSSSPVGNIATDLRCNAVDQYRIYKSSTGNEKLSFDEWFRYRQCICFSGTELSSALAFRNCYNPVSLSVSFDFYRDAAERAPWAGSVAYTAANTEYTCYLIQVGDSVATLSEGACKVADVRLQPQQIVSSMSGAVVRKDQMLDSFGR